MKFERKNLSKVKLEFTIELDATDLASAETEALQKLAPKAKVKGFRLGKAPLPAVKKSTDPNVLSEHTLNAAINHHSSQILIDEKITPLDRPQITIVKFVPEQLLEYKMTVEILPSVELPNYKKLKVKRESVKVDSKEIDQTLERIQKSFAKETEVKRAAKIGDKVVIDFEGFKDDKAFAGGKGTDQNLELGAGQFIPGFEEGVVGKKAGDKFDIDLTFPKDYHAAELKGQPATFKVNLKKVIQLKLPAIDDKLAKKTDMFETLEELKADIKANLLKQKQQQADERFRNQLVDELAEKSKTTIPEVLLQDQIAAVERDMVQNLGYYGQTLDQYLESIVKTRDKWIKEDVEPVAEKRVRAGLALAELGKELKITANEAEVEAKLDELRQQYGKNPEAMKQLQSPEAKRDVYNSIITDKTVDKLVEFNS